MRQLLILVAIDSVLWAAWSFFIGYGVTKISDPKLDGNIVFPVSANSVDRISRRTKIKLWKDLVPELGSFFKGGTSKKSLSSYDLQGLIKFRRETQRAELAHYLFACITPVFFLFNPLFLSLAMVFYAVFANVPFILIQRYNRARIDRLIAKKTQ